MKLARHCDCEFGPIGSRLSRYAKSDPEFKLSIVVGGGTGVYKKVVSTANEGSVAPDDAPLFAGFLFRGRVKKSWRLVPQKAGFSVVVLIVVMVEERVLLECS